MMKKHPGIFRFLLLVSWLAVSACQPKVAQPESLIQTPVLFSSNSSEVSPTETPNPEPTEVHGELLIIDDFESSSLLCKSETAASAFITKCSDNRLTINQSDGRRKVDILVIRELPIQFMTSRMTNRRT